MHFGEVLAVPFLMVGGADDLEAIRVFEGERSVGGAARTGSSNHCSDRLSIIGHGVLPNRM